MMTEQEFESLRLGDYVHFGECKFTVGPRGGAKLKCEEWRCNGKLRSNRVPIKFGMYDYDYIYVYDLVNWHLASDCKAVQDYNDYINWKHGIGRS